MSPGGAGSTIVLRLDTIQPPRGTAIDTTGRKIEIRFDGWLGLLSALTEIVADRSKHA